jgi:multidrug resistance protein, MATE family
MLQSRSFLQQFTRLAIVNILSNLMVPLAGLLDVAFLGHLAEIRHLAGVALATVLVNYLYWTFGFLRMGTTGSTAQAVGRDDGQEVLLIGLRNGAVALGIGLLLVVVQQPLGRLGFGLMSADANVEAAGMAYYHALIWGAPATLLNYVLVGWFLGRGQSGKVLLLSVMGNGAKVLLDYGLIVRGGWLSAGAGYATAGSQFLMMAIGVSLLIWEFRSKPLGVEWKDVMNAAALKAAFGLNSEILVRSFALISTFALFTNLSSLLGTAVLTTNAVLLEVVTFAAFFIDGLAFATERAGDDGGIATIAAGFRDCESGIGCGNCDRVYDCADSIVWLTHQSQRCGGAVAAICHLAVARFGVWFDRLSVRWLFSRIN